MAVRESLRSTLNAFSRFVPFCATYGVHYVICRQWVLMPQFNGQTDKIPQTSYGVGRRHLPDATADFVVNASIDNRY